MKFYHILKSAGYNKKSTNLHLTYLFTYLLTYPPWQRSFIIQFNNFFGAVCSKQLYFFTYLKTVST